ncbi:hypothetical protein Brsp03_03797 [Brucella sp. NBRC 12951]
MAKMKNGVTPSHDNGSRRLRTPLGADVSAIELIRSFFRPVPARTELTEPFRLLFLFFAIGRLSFALPEIASILFELRILFAKERDAVWKRGPAAQMKAALISRRPLRYADLNKPDQCISTFVLHRASFPKTVSHFSGCALRPTRYVFDATSVYLALTGPYWTFAPTTLSHSLVIVVCAASICSRVGKIAFS